MRWFGESWGAPACEPETHAPTPVGDSCLDCRELILSHHQGFIMPNVELSGLVRLAPHHLDCHMAKILAHGPECPHCRGKELGEHPQGCGMRSPRGLCTCTPMPSAEDVITFRLEQKARLRRMARGR